MPIDTLVSLAVAFVLIASLVNHYLRKSQVDRESADILHRRLEMTPPLTKAHAAA